LLDEDVGILGVLVADPEVLPVSLTLSHRKRDGVRVMSPRVRPRALGRAAKLKVISQSSMPRSEPEAFQ